MIAHLVKRGRLYSARIRLDGQSKVESFPLGCTNLQVAEKRLSELISEKEREEAGILAPKLQRESANKPMKAHVQDWIDAKERTRNNRYLLAVRNRWHRLLNDCGWMYAKDIKAADLEKWIGKSELSNKSLNDFLTSATTVLNWMVKHERILANPLKSLESLPADEEKRRPRRAFTDQEFSRLVSETGELGVAYLVAGTTGLRFGEMMELEIEDIRLEDTEPRIVARASTTKNKKTASQPLHPMVVEELRTFLAARKIAPHGKVFAPLFVKRQLLKKDLARLGIAATDDKGRTVDFHSLRHTYCTNLQRLGTHQRALMALMRHSDRRLSDSVYTDTTQLGMNEVVQNLFVPQRQPLSQIRSQDLVPRGQVLARCDTVENEEVSFSSAENQALRHEKSDSDTSCHETEVVRDAGFEPATSCV